MANPVEAALIDPANFPVVPVAAASYLQYSFRNPALERQVFTHRSQGHAPAATDGWAAAIQRSSNSDYNYSHHGSSGSNNNGGGTVIMDNEHLEWLGDAVLKGLTAHLLDKLFPDLREGPLSLLMTALTNNRFYAHLSRLMGLDRRLHVAATSGRAPFVSDRVLGGLFEAYVAGMHRELGVHGHEHLYALFAGMMTPYALAYHRLMLDEEAKLCAGSRRPMDRPSPRAPQDSPSAADAEGYNTAWLNWYTQTRRLPQPQFDFCNVGSGTPRARWVCRITLGPTCAPVSGPEAYSKALAKEAASASVVRLLVQRRPS